MPSSLWFGCILSTALVLQHGRGTGTAGVVNAPVAPDALYVARSGKLAGLSVIDLNGFGASTGDPTYSLAVPIREGNSNFPNNPNVALQGAVLTPPLGRGRTTIDGGSAGVFTLVKSSELGDVLYGGPGAIEVGDLMLGHPLGRARASVPGANPCADPARQRVRVAFSPPGSLIPALGRRRAIHGFAGAGNPISWAPHPNPPPLDPLTLEPDQPTSVASGVPLGFYTNLLVPGANFLGLPDLLVPPTNLLSRAQNAFFVGPDRAQAEPDCASYMVGQPIGHYLYVLDRVSRSVIVLNSNRMTELARLPFRDPTELAMSPDLAYLAVTERGADAVAFVDIDPASVRFHQVVHVTHVEDGPSGIAWEPGNEDILVCSEDAGSISILSAATLEVRKTLRGHDRPFALAITPRQDDFGLRRDVYFAYVLERSGRVLLYESGPDGANGQGYDDVILASSFRLLEPRAIQPDLRRLSSGAWVVHRGWVDAGGQLHPEDLTELALAGTVGPAPIDADPPHPRGLVLEIVRSIGAGQLTGTPLELGFDDQVNLGALRNYHTPFSAGTPAVANGKSLVRRVPGVGVRATSAPSYLFVPTQSLGGRQVDVIDLASGLRVDTNPFDTGVQSIPAGGATHVMHYFRQ